MAGFASDFAKRPVGFKVGVFVAIGVVLAGLYYQLAYKPLKADLDAAEALAAQLKSDEDALQKDEKEFKRLEEEQRVLSKIIEENDQALPTASQLPAFFDMLNRKIGESGVDVVRWDYLKEIPLEGGIAKVPFEMELQGTFYELKRFFYLLYKVSQKEGDEGDAAAAPAAPADVTDVQERDRILTIEDLNIGEPEIKNNELTLIAKFRASTFRKEIPVVTEPTEAEKKKAARANAKKGAAADAKAKAEDAAQKSEDRAGNAGGADAPAGGADKVKGGM